MKLGQLLALWLIAATAWAVDLPDAVKPLTELNGEMQDLAVLDGCVDLSSGRFFIHEQSMVVGGPDPLPFARVHSSNLPHKSSVGFGFGLNVPSKIKKLERVHDGYFVEAETRTKSWIHLRTYDENPPQEFNYARYLYKLGLHNVQGGQVGAHTNPRQKTYHYSKADRKRKDGNWTVTSGDGSVQHYTPKNDHWVLRSIDLPSGNQRRYIYDADSDIKRIETVGSDDTTLINAIDIAYSDNKVVAKGSDGQEVLIHLKGFKQRAKNTDGVSESGTFADWVSGTQFPKTEYNWGSNADVSTMLTFGSVKTPDGRKRTIKYYWEGATVSDIYETVDDPDEKVLKYHLSSFAGNATYSGHAIVTNSLGGQSRYQFDKEHRLASIATSETKDCFTWDDTKLISRRLLSDTGEFLREVKFFYDDRGNVIREELSGCMTAEGKKDTYVKHYTYSDNGFNLLLSEKFPSGRQVLYTYKPRTNLCTESRTVDSAGKVVSRITNSYDDCANLIRTETKTPIANLRVDIKPCRDLAAFGKPQEVSQSYFDGEDGEWKLLRWERYTYNEAGLPVSKESDSGTETFAYDANRRLISHVNLIGDTTSYAYDAVGNRTFERDLKSGRTFRTAYNLQNRPVKTTVGDSKIILSTETQTWNVAGLVTQRTDRFGAVTTFTYDKLEREIKRVGPSGTVTTGYDRFGNRNLITDEDGHRTAIVYNVRGQPLRTVHPDGTQETWEYDIEGNQTRHVACDGTVSTWTYDSLGNCIEEHSVQRFVKRVFKGNVVVRENEQGKITEKSYDSAGRLSEETVHGRRTSYGYDNHGRLIQTNHHDELGGAFVDEVSYDALGRIIEQRTRHSNGTLLSRQTQVYDSLGHVVSERTWITEKTSSITKSAYNVLSELIKSTDALGQTTTYAVRKENGKVEEAVDPLGRRTRLQYDLAGRLVCSQRFDEAAKLISESRMEYDGRGHKVQQTDTRFAGTRVIDEYQVRWAYDSRGRLIQLSEPDKVFTYAYDAAGRLVKATKPDGVVIRRTYTESGDLLTLRSSDRSVDVSYEYNERQQAVRIVNQASKLVVTRDYSIYDEILEECQGPHRQTYAYDALGRCIKHTLPDGTEVVRTYRNGRLHTIQRGDWVHTYDQFDLCGHPLRTSLAGEAGTLSRAWDKKGRPTKIASSAYDVSGVNYNAVDLLTSYAVEDAAGSYYLQAGYDAWDHLISEQGPVNALYTYDSLGNRIERDGDEWLIGPSNQLLSSAKDEYSYDANGNRLSDGARSFTYDALDRLVTVETENETISYRYDGLGRRLFRNAKRLLWSGQCEIGSLTEDGTIGSLRVLAGSTHLEVGAAVLVELKGRIYVPIHDLHGNCVALVNAKTGEVTGHARYSAYGEQTSSGIIGPWRFSSKRYDESTGLHHFGGRDYDATTGRWLTPDPMGFVDGPNLYAYVHNNPLTYVDPCGFWGEGVDNFCAGFNRGVMDDTSWGASELACGPYRCDTWGKRFGYGIGTGASVAAGLFYGNTEAKLAVAGCTATRGLFRRILGETVNYDTARAVRTLEQFEAMSAGSLEKSATAKRIEAIEAHHREQLSNFHLTNPHNTAQLSHSVLDNANFAQKTYSADFSRQGKFRGQNIKRVVEQLQTGQLQPADVPIDYIVRNGNTLILNTRSAHALTEAGIPRSQWTAINCTGKADYERRLSLQLRGNNLTDRGIPEAYLK